MKYLAVFGNTPALSALELGITYHGSPIGFTDDVIDLERVGGTVKVAEIIGEVPKNLQGFEALVLPLIQAVPTDHKTVYGFSVYQAEPAVTKATIKEYAQRLHSVGLDWKKKLKSAERSVRFVVSNEPSLSSVIVTKEHLIQDQTDFVLAVLNDKVVVARTIAVQDYKGYSDRDFGRPQRDHFSGMLPPKVARMMLNIAKPKTDDVILDPFCGSGTVIQEALALGFTNVMGSDISEKCIKDTTANLEWAKLPIPELHVSDVLNLPTLFQKANINVVVAEGYLGPQKAGAMDKQQFHQLTYFYKEVFKALAQIVKPGARVMLALPAWVNPKGGLTEMDLDAAIQAAGFKAFHKPVYYGREQARVVRKIYCLAV